MTVISPQLKTQLPSRMMSALIYEPGQVRYEEVPFPQPGPGEITIQVEAALTCGTDLKTYRRGHPVLIKRYPSGFGHECAGRVVALGEGVEGFKLGERVIPANSAPCYECFFCQKGQTNLCEHLDLLNGAYAQYLKIPAQIVQHNTLKVPEETTAEMAAFTEPLSVSLRGVEVCNIQPGDWVAVLGIGPIGLLIAYLARQQGANVVALGRNPLKLDAAKAFAGVVHAVDLSAFSSDQDILQQFSPQGRGFDVVIEAAGTPQTWEKAINLVRRGGLVNLFGGCPSGSKIHVDTRRLHYDEITLVSPFHHTPRHFRKALEMINSGKIDPSPLVTHAMPLSEVVSALGLVDRGEAIKVLLQP